MAAILRYNMLRLACGVFRGKLGPFFVLRSQIRADMRHTFWNFFSTLFHHKKSYALFQRDGTAVCTTNQFQHLT